VKILTYLDEMMYRASTITAGVQSTGVTEFLLKTLFTVITKMEIGKSSYSWYYYSLLHNLTTQCHFFFGNFWCCIYFVMHDCQNGSKPWCAGKENANTLGYGSQSPKWDLHLEPPKCKAGVQLPSSTAMIHAINENWDHEGMKNCTEHICKISVLQTGLSTCICSPWVIS
jgi:hypothetical protein